MFIFPTQQHLDSEESFRTVLVVLARPGDGLGFSHQALADREEGVSHFRGLSLRGKPCCLSRPGPLRGW